MGSSAVAVHPTAYIFVFVTLVGALLAVHMRNILHAVFGLALALVGIAALFVYLGSPFLGAMEVLIYAGGISVAMVFAVMFAYDVEMKHEQRRTRGRTVLAALAALLFIVSIGAVLWNAEFAAPVGSRDWSVGAIGRALLLRYNLVFETLSVVLLLAIVGAIIIARRPEDRQAAAGGAPAIGHAASGDKPAGGAEARSRSSNSESSKKEATSR
jgi:NADH:ubiquinone oxidoreductase subunit 6 (subunit J)